MTDNHWTPIHESLLGTKRGDRDLDQQIWALLRGDHVFPLPHYQIETWEACIREGQPEAQLTTDPGAFAQMLADDYPQSRIGIDYADGKLTIRLDLVEDDISVCRTRDLPITEMALALTSAYIEARQIGYERQLSAPRELPGMTP